jgi:DUF1365 family protein
MDHRYACRLPAPAHHLSAEIDNIRGGAPVFKAALQLQRVPLTDAELRRVTRRYPFGSARVLALIYGHAVGTRLAGVHAVPHPRTQRSEP